MKTRKEKTNNQTKMKNKYTKKKTNHIFFCIEPMNSVNVLNC